MKWDEMSPRERDVLVAEKVMGWTDFSPINPDVDYEVGVNGHRRNFAFPPGGKYQPIPHYTTDLSAAWEVVEEMQTKGFYIDVLSFSDHYVAVPHLSNGHEPVDDGVATTAPEAICKAALNAMEVEIE